jgi:hypothetical protein
MRSILKRGGLMSRLSGLRGRKERRVMRVRRRRNQSSIAVSQSMAMTSIGLKRIPRIGAAVAAVITAVIAVKVVVAVTGDAVREIAKTMKVIAVVVSCIQMRGAGFRKGGTLLAA